MLSIGDVIRKSREDLKISQEELSFGICSTSNLSRIENGAQIPSRITYEALMQRLGQSSEVFPSFFNERELETFRLKHQINQYIMDSKYDSAEKLLAKLDGASQERLIVQLVKYVEAILYRERGGAPNIVLEKFQEVAKMSIKCISPQSIPRQVLTRDELYMLNNLAFAHYDLGEHAIGIEYLYSVKKFIEKHVVDDKGISPIYTMILYNLSKLVGLDGNIEEAIKLCDVGIQRCIEYNAYADFSGLLFNKGYALVMLGRKGEAQKYLQEAYYLKRATNELESCETIKKFTDKQEIDL